MARLRAADLTQESIREHIALQMIGTVDLPEGSALRHVRRSDVKARLKVLEMLALPKVSSLARFFFCFFLLSHTDC